MCGRVETNRLAVKINCLETVLRQVSHCDVTVIVLCVILEQLVRPISSNAPRPHRVLIGHVRCDAGGTAEAEPGDEENR